MADSRDTFLPRPIVKRRMGFRCVQVAPMPLGVKVPDSRTLRKRAEDCRTLAEVVRHHEPRLKLLEIATDYDVMATQAETLEKQESEQVESRPLTIMST